MSDIKEWISSKEAQKTGEINGCDLMHYRVQGKLEFEKRGNAYFYSKESIKKHQITQLLIKEAGLFSTQKPTVVRISIDCL